MNNIPTAQYQNVTPAMAAQYLKANTNNPRKLNKMNLKRLKTELTGGLWVATTQGVGFDTDGVLVDGQHTLTAIVDTGVTAENLLVCYNLSPKSRYKIDVGRKRDLSDHTGIHPKVIATVRVPFRAVGSFKTKANNLTFMEPYLNGELGNLSQDLHNICKDVRGVMSHGVRAGLILSIMSGNISKTEGIKLFTTLTKLRKNNNGSYLTRSLKQRRAAQNKLPNLLLSLVEKIEQGIVPVYDDKTGKFVDATDVREQASKIMFLSMQAFDPKRNKGEEFTSPSHTDVTNALEV
jgi:hypothetical protein